LDIYNIAKYCYKFDIDRLKNDIIRLQRELHGYNWDDYMLMDFMKFLDIKNSLIKVIEEDIKNNKQ
jgi:hypothetical protein